ncbi:CPCC family cysteine-rich protein [Planococcus sp. 1R117A]|uniref:CPCC family cysteine-rich protein n=1 Tax=Planococcus sp. 1R117A TaxID=3447020 RepID=UPI003EDC7FB0
MRREKCPCCGYPTLQTRGDFEICLLCDWEDENHDELSTAEVFGGPNGDYSLEEARNNFQKNFTMYREKNDFDAITAGKKKLIKAYEEWEKDKQANKKEKWNEIRKLENELKLLS